MRDKYFSTAVETLERFSAIPFEDDPEGWTDLITNLLSLPLAYEPAVRMALAEGRWRTATSPFSYVHSAARNLANGLGIAAPVEERFPNLAKEIPVSSLSRERESYSDTLERLQSGIDEDEDEVVSIISIIRRSEIDWHRVAIDAGLGPEIGNYLNARALVDFRRHPGLLQHLETPALKKRFQRSRRELARAVAIQVNEQAGELILSESVNRD